MEEAWIQREKADASMYLVKCYRNEGILDAGLMEVASERRSWVASWCRMQALDRYQKYEGECRRHIEGVKERSLEKYCAIAMMNSETLV